MSHKAFHYCITDELIICKDWNHPTDILSHIDTNTSMKSDAMRRRYLTDEKLCAKTWQWNDEFLV